uniref:Uncharacterized protein n=1 Tax=Salix viminalis TaxID=40686 RepID=A0A6N2NKA3_SALVM
MAYVKPASEEYGRIPESDLWNLMGMASLQGEEYGSGYGRRPESEYESGDHERPSEYGSGYGRRQESELRVYVCRTMRGHRVRNMDLGMEERVVGEEEKAMGEGANMRSQFIEMIQLRGLVMGDRREEESLREPSHGSRRIMIDDDEDRRSKYRDGGEEGHGRKKYVGFSQNFQLIMLYGFLCNVRSFSVHGNGDDNSDDDDTEKMHHHHRKNYDD